MKISLLCASVACSIALQKQHRFPGRSWQTVRRAAAKRVHAVAHRPIDWFERKLRHRATFAASNGATPSPFTSVLNLVNGSIDAGILAMPLLLSMCGWLLGSAVLVLIATLGVFTTCTMIEVGLAERTQSYHMTISAVLGRLYVRLFNIMLIVACLGSLLAYLMLIGDFAQTAALQMLGHTINRRVAIALMAVCVVLPLTLMRKVKSLWFTGLMAIVFVAFFVSAMVVKLGILGISTIDPAESESTLEQGLGHGHIRALDTTALQFFQALPIAVFSFQNHAVVFPVFSEMNLKLQTLPVFTTVSKWTFAVILALYGGTA